ncbi:hypothetical protein CQW23_01574 [Capsicum baccatum]|uniref:Uncharacterized protein n=1 Tax=Capsicum baccatum TaxID=33114 RepID=A0A2G2XPD1_CAPBA|nr:hypothetical protein CQW23_01574 [Capsicum baccatum]
MKKKSTKNFREYAIRWREQAARVKPPMKESKIVEVFIQAPDEKYYQYLLPASVKPFIEVLKIGEMIEDGIKIGHIGHSIEDCRYLKREIEKMIQDKSIMVQNINSGKSSSHADVQTSG